MNDFKFHVRTDVRFGKGQSDFFRSCWHHMVKKCFWYMVAAVSSVLAYISR